MTSSLPAVPSASEQQAGEASAGKQRPKEAAPHIAGALSAAGIVVSLAQTLVVPILGRLPEMFHAPATSTSWVVTVTLLAGAVSTPVLGRLADLYGKRRMLLLAFIPFVLGSVVCALAGDLVMMIVGRGLQGLSIGIVPLGIAMLHDVLPKEKAGAAIALMSSSMGIGGALGLPLAAGVTELASWRVLFWGTAVLAVVVVAVLWRMLPRTRVAAEHEGFDWAGAIGLAIGLVALFLAISKGAEWGWGSAVTIACAGVAVVVLVLWGWFESRHHAPLVDVKTTLKPVVLLTNLASIFVGFSMYAMSLILPQLMQLPVETGYGLGQSMVAMGLWIAPLGLGMLAVSRFGADLSSRYGPRSTLVTAGLVIAAGYGATALVLGTLGARLPGAAADGVVVTELVLLAVCVAVVGCGIGLAFGAMPDLILGAVPADEKAAANGFNALMRSLGTTSSAAVVGVVLGAMTQAVGGGFAPTHAGFLVALLLGCGAALAATGIAVAIPRRRVGAGS